MTCLAWAGKDGVLLRHLIRTIASEPDCTTKRYTRGARFMPRRFQVNFTFGVVQERAKHAGDNRASRLPVLSAYP